MKKGDIAVICSVAVAFVLSIVLLNPLSKQGSRVVVKQDNKIVYNERININKTVETPTNTVIIKDGIVYISNATCKNQVCVNTGKISKKGESIICLPNKVIVEIK